MSDKKLLRIAVVGSGDIVTKELISIIEDRDLPVKSIDFIAPKESEGRILQYKDENRIVTPILEHSFADIDLVFLLLLEEDAENILPLILASNSYVIDVVGTLKSHEDIPLAVPDINPEIIKDNDGKVICVPTSIAIQLSTILHPIKKKYGLERVLVSTYQSVSNKGEKAIDELAKQTISLLSFEEIKSEKQHGRMAFNCLPETDSIDQTGYTKQEIDIEFQLKRILEQEDLNVSINSVTVPVFHCDSLSVNIETAQKIPQDQLKDIYKDSSYIISLDDPQNSLYPTATLAANKNEIFVGRIREDRSTKRGINLWCVMDNLRKGSALTAVQIAEELINLNCFP